MLDFTLEVTDKMLEDKVAIVNAVYGINLKVTFDGLFNCQLIAVKIDGTERQLSRGSRRILYMAIGHIARGIEIGRGIDLTIQSNILNSIECNCQPSLPTNINQGARP